MARAAGRNEQYRQDQQPKKNFAVFLHNCRKPRAIRVVCQATVVSGLSPTVIKVFRPIAKPQISRPIDVRI